MPITNENKKPIAEERGVELFYAPSEAIFGAVAAEMVRLGWSVFPQSSEGRLPGSVFGEMIRWGSAGHDLKNRRPSPEAMRLWLGHCATLNVATVFGPASGNAFAIDIDVTDEPTVDAIVAIADRVLGYTPLRREGRAPKFALIYRSAPDDAPRSISRTLAGDDGHMVEVLGAGKVMTFHGKHHKTGRYFKWSDALPMSVGPDAATLVTSAQVDAFVSAVEAKFGFERPAGNAAVFAHHVGHVALEGTGAVESGRYHWTQAMVFQTARENKDIIRRATTEGPTAKAAVKKLLTEHIVNLWHANAVCSGKWTAEHVASTISRDVSVLVDKVASGKLFNPDWRPPPSRVPPPTAPPRREAPAAVPPTPTLPSRPTPISLPRRHP